jgi:hypothetical protein
MRFINNFLIIIILIIASGTCLHAEEWYDATDYDKKLQVDVSLLTAFPSGKFSDIYDFGYGAMTDFSYAPGYMQNFRIAFRTGFIKFEPEEETDDGFKTGVGDSYIIPFLASVEYRQKLFRSFLAVPVVTGGYAILKAEYMDRSGTVSGGVPTGYPAEKKDEITFEPFVSAGLGFHYIINLTDSIFLRGEWCTVVEPDDLMYFGTSSVGYEKRF